jgi:hypothetical protein
MEKWQEFLGQGVLLLGVVAVWATGAISSAQLAAAASVILGASNIAVGVKEYKEYQFKLKAKK